MHTNRRLPDCSSTTQGVHDISTRPVYRQGVGGHPYWYFVPYEQDAQAALDKLRAREFSAGRYNPVIRYLEFSEPAFSAQRPGPAHASIEEAFQEAAEGGDGTRSILDLASVGTRPDFGVAAKLPASKLQELFGTEQPTRQMAEQLVFLEDIMRGQGAYFAIYANGEPSELCFAGYSYD
jgi:hypothetical protein